MEPLEDRLCIASEGKTDLFLSPQYLVSCDKNEGACEGGEAPSAFKWLEANGTVSESCYPYNGTNGTCGAPGTCLKAGQKFQLYKCKTNTFKQFSKPDDIKRELVAHGPMHCAFDVYADFKDYQGGIYVRTSDRVSGGHGIELIGYGIENGIFYWICKNSWVLQFANFN